MMEKPKLLIVAGPNGSGKTSVTDKILTKQYATLHDWANVIFQTATGH